MPLFKKQRKTYGMNKRKLNYSSRDFCGMKLTLNIQKPTHEMHADMKINCVVMHPFTQHFKGYRYLFIPCALILKNSAFYPQSIISTIPSFSIIIQLVFIITSILPHKWKYNIHVNKPQDVTADQYNQSRWGRRLMTIQRVNEHRFLLTWLLSL